MRQHPYDKLFDRKRKWSPVKPTAGKLKEGAEETILRALSIRHMELPVGSFISEGLEKSVPDNARKLLESNVEDEERHDLALGYIADVHNVNEKDEKEGKLLRDAWINHPDHTVLKALVAERAIFFVLLPFFRLMAILLFAQYQQTSAETNKSMLQVILLYVQSWVFILVLAWTVLGRQLFIGF